MFLGVSIDSGGLKYDICPFGIQDRMFSVFRKGYFTVRQRNLQ